ncbi:MAG: TROVE domain-containing protein [Ferruginibacter sp.]|nr:TROVE domain-containing protein [Cytophagales bacterium]
MKFNVSTAAAQSRNAVTNHEGARAYALTPALELYTAVVTAALSDQFYEKADGRLARLRALIAKNDPVFVAQLAVYAREQMHLRTVPLVLVVELAKIHNGDNLVSRLVARVVQRADEITELLAYYQLANERKGAKKLGLLSKQMQKGLALAFNRFDAYQFAKYDRQTEVKLRDALFLVHPKAASAEQQSRFDRIANGTLATPYTWETELSALGQRTFEHEAAKQAAFRVRWEELIDSGKLGYMALLRNLRNLLEARVSQLHAAKVARRLADAREVAKSKQLPFRFLSAYREVKPVVSPNATLILTALEAAVATSAANIRGFDADTRVLIACDVSGSMQKAISAKSTVQNYDIGLMLGMLLQSRAQSVVTGIFGDTWKVINLPQRNVLANVGELHRREGEVGYATNGYLVIKDLIARKLTMDKVMLFTDCQLWNSQGSGESIPVLWDHYQRIAPHARLYLFDLAGYGNVPVRVVGNVSFVAGWSDKVFDVLAAIENGGSALTEIGKVDL